MGQADSKTVCPTVCYLNGRVRGYFMRAVQSMLILICLAGLLFSQGTDLGTIRGTVTDASGAVVPNAKVVLSDLQTNITRELKTNHDGNYEAFGLKAGNYKAEVTMPGFATEEI